MRKSKFLSVVMSIIVMAFHLCALKAEAVDLNKADTSEFLNAVTSIEHSTGSKREFMGLGYDTSSFNGSKNIGSFAITDLDEPLHGKLLDTRATIIADNGVFWEIPVLWVDEDGNEISIHLDIRKSYPVFVFFIPDGYSIKKSDFGDFNIVLPDFVSEILSTNGMLSLADPSKGLIYFTTRLGGKNEQSVDVVQVSAADLTDTNDDIEIVNQITDNLVQTTEPRDDIIPEQVQNDICGIENEAGQNVTDSVTTPPTTDNDNSLSESEQSGSNIVVPSVTADIVSMHCDQNAINAIGYDELEWLVKLVKYNIEPQAVNLLLDRFPAYQAAADNNELGKNIGLYIYYDDYTDSQGGISNQSDAVAGVAGKNNGDTYSYRIVLNASKVFDYDVNTDTYSHDEELARESLDNTILHELMHAFMYDYTRPGMTGEQYNTTTEEIEVNDPSSAVYSDVKYPTWFVEGMASTVENSVQAYNDTMRSSFGYDNSTESYDISKIQYSYTVDKSLQLAYADSPQVEQADTIKSAYMSGYLANVYLGYLAALKYDGVDAIDGSTGSGTYSIDSSVIRGGVNHILEELHNGKTLDDVISEISQTDSSNPAFIDTEDFTKKFIKSGSGGSQEFVTNFLNYIESISTDDEMVNGSILMDFTDAALSPLQPENAENAPVYVPADTKEFVDSTVLNEDALQAGGSSETGITDGTHNSNDETNIGGNNGNDETNTGGNNPNDEIHSGYNSNDEFHFPGSGGFGEFDEFHVLKMDSSSLIDVEKEQAVMDTESEMNVDLSSGADQESNIKEASADDSLDQAASDDPEEGMVVDIPSAERELLENPTTEEEIMAEDAIKDTLDALENAEYVSSDDTTNSDDDTSEADTNEDALVNNTDDGAGKEEDVPDDGNGEPTPEEN
ncbi:hypothetical protein [Butyrivibrio sp. VCB2001]|uniref:hypothetical protein n=1 Tax=Butyrivibrio sp. VCB2001 TaxID=1280667 RepID=UPI0003FBFC09|nr:hypothetical protein [Butyrivibrio sp. VCB2001]